MICGGFFFLFCISDELSNSTMMLELEGPGLLAMGRRHFSHLPLLTIVVSVLALACFWWAFALCENPDALLFFSVPCNATS
jgi:hypothetical protein